MLLGGCCRYQECTTSSVPSEIESRIGYSIESDSFEPLCECLNEWTVNSSVAFALVNHPKIRGYLAEIGIAQADLIAAGLPNNPLFDAFFRFPNESGFFNNYGLTITQTILDLFLVPIREKTAQADLERVSFHVAHLIMDVAFDVEEAFYALQAQRTIVQGAKQQAELAEIMHELAKRQLEAGNNTILENARHLQEYLKAQASLAQEKAEEIRLKEQFCRSLGIACTDVRIQGDLTGIPDCEPHVECLETFALDSRLDLQMIRWDINRLLQSSPLYSPWVYTDLAAGVSIERDPEGVRSTGPALTGAIPLFNYGQADRLRLHYKLSQLQAQLDDLELQVLCEVRYARDRLKVQRDLALLYQNSLLPEQKRLLEESQNYYNVMGLSIYTLLDVKKQEVELQAMATRALRDYWLTRVALDRAVGGNLRLLDFQLESCCCEGYP